MSAQSIARNAPVTPVRPRRRPGRLRGPSARQQVAGAPQGRPSQPAGPQLSGPVELRLEPAARLRPAAVGNRQQVAGGRVQLTDRGLLAVMVLLAVLTAATLAVGLVSFLSVSNEPLPPSGQAVGVQLQG